MTPCVRIFYPSEFTHFFKQGANQRRNEPTYDDTTRPMRCKADEYQRRQDKLNLENPSKRKIFAKKITKCTKATADLIEFYLGKIAATTT